MKRFIAKLDKGKIRKTYPIAGLVEGWFFRQSETSNGVWIVEGTDLWGRLVSKQGEDADALLKECVLAAQDVQRWLTGD